MFGLSQQELKSVIAETHEPAISIFLPTHRAGREIQQDPIRLKNLLKRAGEQLIQGGSRPADARELLAPITDLLDDNAFWRHQSDGLALFRSRDVFRVYRVPLSLSEFVSVSDRFYLKPLLPLLVNDARFYVLALSQKNVRLLECTRDQVHPIDLPEVPQGLEAALSEGRDPQLQHHSVPMGATEATQFHGQGVGTDDFAVANLTQYFHRVDRGLNDVLTDGKAPLVLACVDYLAPLFRRVTRYHTILEPVLSGNPDGLSDAELQQKAWELVEPYFLQERTIAAAKYHQGLAEGRAGHQLAEVLPAAHQGRIATLFVPLGVRRWGRYIFDSSTLDEHDQEQPGDDELLDLASIQTVLHGGTVYGVRPEEIPDQQVLAAVYRF